MHTEVLTDKQRELLPLIKIFSNDFYLVGGTAIALHIGHRRSIDFDLFTSKSIKREGIKYQIKKNNYLLDSIVHEDSEQLHLVVNSIKMTFYSFPFKIENLIDFKSIIKMPSLLDLAAMKAYALGGRAKWKDYVDLYFILKSYYTFDQVSEKAESIFKEYFNEKLFRQQLCYFKDIDYSEPIEFIGEEIFEDEIKEFMVDVATIHF
ncbi:nucleotidyl transferase AbiEii/AbiGii toxin family protein [bacterium]|nr:nucleotidyl transferase AbiEii/AbiGii toxin family protein [bacterium]MBU1615195.1 nucleotidyl transferase AbiEii/AbiGii toxin family protein [bacterium]